MSRVLALTRDYDAVVFPFYSRVGDTAAVLRHGLPVEPMAARAYFLDRIEHGGANELRPAWDWLRRHRFADRQLLRRYLLRLLEDENYDEAAALFEESLPASERTPDDNHITHGGFEVESSGAPLDWVITATPHAQVRRDDSFAWEGAWSLRIEFDGLANLEYRHVAQQVVVRPGPWKLAARIRTQGVASDQGLGLRIFDARSASKWQIWTAAATGDSDWRLIEKSITIRPSTRLVRIEIARRLSRKLDNKLDGVIWVDAVSLTPR